MEQYYEQNVVNKNIDEKVAKTKTLTIAKTVCIIIALGALLTIILFISDESFLFWLGMLILIATPFAVAAIILGIVNKRNNTEFDYTIDSDGISITEVYFRESRKEKYKIPFRNIESVGVFDSDGYKRVQNNINKKHLAVVNLDDEKSIIYVYYVTDKGKDILFLEPDRGFLMALKRSVSAVTVFDKSISELEKRLDEATIQNDLS